MPKTKLMNIAQIAALATAENAPVSIAATLEETPENVIQLPTAPVKVAPKQYFVGCTGDRKAEIQELAAKYVGPGVTKSYPMTEKEAVELLWHVATNRRFETVENMTAPAIVDDDGNAIVDDDGQAVYGDPVPTLCEIDHFELEVKRIFAMRDVAPDKAVSNSKEGLMAQMAKIQAKLKALGLVAE